MADEKKAAQHLVPKPDGTVMVEVLMGPYRGQHLTMSAADGQAALAANWARDPSEAIYEHEPLSDEDRKAAWDASHAWAQAQWDAAQSVEPPAEGGDGRRRRSMEAEQAGGYATRHQEPPPRARR